MEQSQFAGKSILITGASGFIGTHLCNRLRKHHAEIHAISRFNKPTNLKNSIQWWQADITDTKTVETLLSSIQPKYIFNLAGYVNGSRDISTVLPTFENNLLGPINLMMCAHKVGCERFISAGSMEEPDLNHVTYEISSPYSAAKWSASIYGKMFYNLYNFPFVSLRIFMTYGPGQRDIKKVLPYSILSLLLGKAPNLASGQRKIDWIFVDDVVDSMIAAALAPGVEGKRLDIGSGSSISIQSVVQMLTDSIHPGIEPNYGALSDRLFEQEPIADVEKTFAWIKWKPKIALESGLRQTVRWYEKNIDNFKEVYSELYEKKNNKIRRGL